MIRARQHDADRALAVRVGGAVEQDVDRRARVLHQLVGRQRDVAVLEQHVVVGRAEIDVELLEPGLVVRVTHHALRVRAQDVCERAVLRVDRPVLDDDDRLADGVVETVQQTADGVETTPRCSDHDHVVGHRIFR